MQGQVAFPAELRTSDKGLRIMGPVPSPATKRLNPSVHTMRLVSNSGISWPYVDVYKEDVQVLCARFSSASPRWIQPDASVHAVHSLYYFSAVICDGSKGRVLTHTASSRSR
jgi:hypothetical protein